MNRDKAIQATTHGAYTAFVIAGFTALFVVGAIVTGATEFPFSYFNDPLYFIDVVIMACCGIGMLRQSRAAAVFALLYWVASKLMLWLDMGQVSGIGMGLLVAYFFGNAVIGSFTFHKLERAENPAYRPAPRWTFWVGIPAGLLVAAMLVFGALIELGVMPDSQVLPADQIPAGQLEQIVDAGIVWSDEEVLFFYSDGFVSVMEAGVVLSTDRVTRYWMDEDQNLQIYDVLIRELASIEQVYAGNDIEDAIYQINLDDGESWVQVPLSTFEDHHLRFVETVRALVAEQTVARADIEG